MTITAVTDPTSDTDIIWLVPVKHFSDVIEHICDGYAIQLGINEARYRIANKKLSVSDPVANRNRVIAMAYEDTGAKIRSIQLLMSFWINGKGNEIDLYAAMSHLAFLVKEGGIHPVIHKMMIKIIKMSYRKAMNALITREMASLKVIQHPV